MTSCVNPPNLILNIPQTLPFTVIATHPGQPFNYAEMQAISGAFYLGLTVGPNQLAPTTGCAAPPLAPTACAAYLNRTVLRPPRPGSPNLLAVDVPGGQRYFVASDGALSYTSPGAATGDADLPPGADTGGITVYAGDTLQTEGGFFYDRGPWLACPVAGLAGPAWRVYARVPGLVFAAGCVETDMFASEWQFDDPVGAYEFV